MRRAFVSLAILFAIAFGGVAALRTNPVAAGTSCLIYADNPFPDGGGGTDAHSSFWCRDSGGNFQLWSRLEYWSSSYGAFVPSHSAYGLFPNQYADGIFNHAHAGYPTYWINYVCATDGNGYGWCQSSGKVWINNTGG